MTVIKEIKNKISSINNTKKITKAMEMVAISKLYKIKEIMRSSKPYRNLINEIVNRIASIRSEHRNQYYEERTIKNVGYLIISTDRGLIGSLNNNLFKKILIEINNFKKKEINIELVLIGSYAISFFKSLKIKIIYQISRLEENPKLSILTNIVQLLLKKYKNKFLDKLYIASNQFVNPIVQIPKIFQILPLSIQNNVNLKNKIWDYLYEPNEKMILDTLLHKYIEFFVYQNIIENTVSEQAARMLVMKSATDNSNDLIKKLQISHNKVRQDNITKEIIEIISGYSVI